MKKVTTIILILAMLTVSVPVFAGTENDGPMVGDTLAARPLGLVSIGVGAALWVLSFPFAIMSGNIEKTTETFIANPVKYTVVRQVGDFDYELTSTPAEEAGKQ
jgi:hypothetical protein